MLAFAIQLIWFQILESGSSTCSSIPFLSAYWTSVYLPLGALYIFLACLGIFLLCLLRCLPCGYLSTNHIGIFLLHPSGSHLVNNLLTKTATPSLYWNLLLLQKPLPVHLQLFIPLPALIMSLSFYWVSSSPLLPALSTITVKATEGSSHPSGPQSQDVFPLWFRTFLSHRSLSMIGNA